MSFQNQNFNRRSAAYLDIAEFLRLQVFPGRLCVWQTAAILGCEEHHVPILVKAKLLKPLGNPPRNAPKYFARDYVLRLACNVRWLARMSDALVEHWANRNSKTK